MKQNLKLLPALLLILTLLPACSGKKQSYTVNWFLRLEYSAAGDDYHLMAGQKPILPSVDEAIWNGDSLVVKAGEACYYLDMARAVDYHSTADMSVIDCTSFEHYVKVGGHGWPP